MQIKLNHHIITLTPGCTLLPYYSDFNGDKWWLDILYFLEQWANNSPVIQLKTSGSTGEPKIIEVEKWKMWASAQKTCIFFNLTENSKALLCLSANYIAGQMMLVRAMVSQMQLICVEPSSNQVKDLTMAVDFSAMVPMQVKESMNSKDKFNLVKQLIIGGGQLPFNVAQQLKNTTVKAFETYGMTETLSHIAVREISPNYEDYFTAFQGVTIGQGAENQLILSCDDLKINRLETNDIIDLKPDNRFKWLGRLDFIINSGGVKLSPENIEAEIRPLLPDNNHIISSLPDERLGEKVILVIEGQAFKTDTLLAKMKEALSPYAVPKEIRFLAEFPLTVSGKIKRKEIQNLLRKYYK